MSHRPLRVLKVGGSLLSFPHLQSALRDQIAEQPEAHNVLVPGGGPFANMIRNADERFVLAPDDAHWLAIKAMGISAHLLMALLPEAVKEGNLLALKQLAGNQPLIIVDPEPLLRGAVDELGPDRLPHDWSVTSDSIAARIAEAINADELVLLKSSLPPESADWQEAADAGFVDAYFPTAAAGLRCIRALSLRHATMDIA